VPETRYEAGSYWESTLATQFDLSGVGYPGLPVSFNRCFYRAQVNAVERVLRQAGTEVSPGWSTLDVGSGVGFWIEFWHRAGAREVTGVDLTESAVTRLRQRFPQASFERLDVSEGTPWEARFDAISAMSVLLHIKEEERFHKAIANIANALKPDGALVVIDPVVVGRWWGPPFGSEANSIARSVGDWKLALARSDLEVAAMVPATVLLANAVDTRHRISFRLLSRYWELLCLLLPRLGETGGRVVGEALYLLDRWLVRVVSPGPSAKCLVIRKRNSG
jgi:SAM-dependent methyltransferase